MEIKTKLVSVNVGGTIFQFNKDLLRPYPDSILSKMILGIGPLLPPSFDKDGNIFLDIDPLYFSIILDFLRHNTFFFPQNPLTSFNKNKLWHIILDYFQLPIERYHLAIISAPFQLKIFNIRKYFTQELEKLQHRVWSHQSGEIAFHLHTKCRCKLYAIYVDEIIIQNIQSKVLNKELTFRIDIKNNQSFTYYLKPEEGYSEPTTLIQNKRISLLDISFSVIENTEKPTSISSRNQIKLTFDFIIKYKFEKENDNQKLVVPKAFMFEG